MLLAACFAFTVLLLLGSYIYFMRRDPDALRSESYSLQKLAIEKGIFGDNLVGMIDPDRVIETPEVVNALPPEGAKNK